MVVIRWDGLVEIFDFHHVSGYGSLALSIDVSPSSSRVWPLVSVRVVLPPFRPPNIQEHVCVCKYLR